VKYAAVFVDGTRVEGRTLAGWQTHTGGPTLDSVPLMDEQRPLRWLRDLTLAPYKPQPGSPGFVEFAGGDRLPGRVVAFVQEAPGGSAGPQPHLVVRTDPPVHFPGQPERQQVRVLARAVRRIVLGEDARGDLAPGTVLCRDGRQFSYRNLRLEEDDVRFLTADGVHEMSVLDIAEIAFPRRDLWQAYYEQLAVLSPEFSARLMRLETVHGVIVTGSRHRFRAQATGNAQQQADPDYWYHMVQPAWSLDPLWVHFSTIRTRLYFAPDEIPLSWLTPVRSVQPALLGEGWPWQRDCNVQGGTLHSGGHAHGWGIGVRAPHSLWFELPDGVRSFRSRAGLDSLAGSGGCARALVYVNEPSGTPLYQSPYLVGSDQVIDTGTLPLAGPSGKQEYLILVADAAHQGRPRGADPLNVRDTVDWLDPILHLDPAKLKAELGRSAIRAVPGWHGWNASIDGEQALRLQARWDDTDDYHHKYGVSAGSGGQSVTLTTRLPAGEELGGFRLSLRQVAEQAAPGRMEVLLGDHLVATLDVPQYGWMPRIYIPVPRRPGQSREARVVYSPRDAGERIEWLALQPVGWLTPLDWSVLQPTAAASSGGATLEPLDDGSLLAAGTSPDEDTYTVTASTTLERITAFRIEALDHESLPNGGPGRAADGSFAFSELTVRLVPPSEEIFEGRYLRIELPGARQKILSLAEVQVFSGSQNVALAGKTTQSSVVWEGVPERAIDGNTSGQWQDGSITHTDEAEENPWWELDLGAVRPIDRIAVFNRTDPGLHVRLNHFRVTLLDANRAIRWQRIILDPPAPSVELVKSMDNIIPLKHPGHRWLDTDGPQIQARGNVWPVDQVWAMMPEPDTPQVAVFLPTVPIDVRGGKFTLTLKTGATGRRTLGRFRLSATSDPWPAPP
jgi:hypothetical protein